MYAILCSQIQNEAEFGAYIPRSQGRITEKGNTVAKLHCVTLVTYP